MDFLSEHCPRTRYAGRNTLQRIFRPNIRQVCVYLRSYQHRHPGMCPTPMHVRRLRSEILL